MIGKVLLGLAGQVGATTSQISSGQGLAPIHPKALPVASLLELEETKWSAAGCVEAAAGHGEGPVLSEDLSGVSLSKQHKIVKTTHDQKELHFC